MDTNTSKLTDQERTELLDWVSACQSSYHIDSTPNHRFGGLPSNLQENRDGLVEHVESIIEARLSAQPERKPVWQPIETAPKDGTEVLLLFSRSEYILGKVCGRTRAACWTGSGSAANWSIPYFKDDSPTHWTPLHPEQPESNGIIAQAKEAQK
jgi:hypothetical protein